MSNPLDLRGPEFLQFYLCLGAGLLTLLWMARVFVDRLFQSAGPWDEHDPYALAWLQGGMRHAINVAILSLLERGLMEHSESTIKATSTEAVGVVRRPLEKAILHRFAHFSPARLAWHDDRIGLAAESISDALTEAGLLPSVEQRRLRALLSICCSVLLLGMGVAKLYVALERGRANVGFLLFLLVFYAIGLWHLARYPRTGLGGEELRRLRRRFQRLRDQRDRLQRTGTTSEVTLLMALFGLHQLPDGLKKIARKLKLMVVVEQNNPTCGHSSGCSTGSCGGGGGCGGGGCGGCGS